MDPLDPNNLYVKQLLAEIAALKKTVGVMRYGMENCYVTLTCNEEGGGGTITITFPAPGDPGPPGPPGEA